MIKDAPLSIPEQMDLVIDSINENLENNIRENIMVLINELIEKDFNSLLQLLYRMDVDETKIRKSLHNETGEDASSIIADLIIERQLQKIETRNKIKTRYAPESEEEKW